jgi:hypothetical protein
MIKKNIGNDKRIIFLKTNAIITWKKQTLWKSVIGFKKKKKKQLGLSKLEVVW